MVSFRQEKWYKHVEQVDQVPTKRPQLRSLVLFKQLKEIDCKIAAKFWLKMDSVSESRSFVLISKPFKPSYNLP